MKRNTQEQRKLSDLLTPKRPRLESDSGSVRAGGASLHIIQATASTYHHDLDPGTDTSTTTSNVELDILSLDTATSSSSVLETNPESTTVSRTITPNDIAKSRECEPIHPVLRQFPKRMISGKLRSFSSQWYAPYPFMEYSVRTDAVYCYACRLFPPPRGHIQRKCLLKQASETGKRSVRGFRSMHSLNITKIAWPFGQLTSRLKVMGLLLSSLTHSYQQ